MNLSKSFTLEEMTTSQEAARAGLKNKPSEEAIANLKALCENVLQPLRDRIRKPIVVSSGYRSVTINRIIGGSSTSQHTKGQAVDFIVPGMSVADVVTLIRKMDLPIDQTINEYNSWVHVSYGPRHRRQYLKAWREGGKTVYKPM